MRLVFRFRGRVWGVGRVFDGRRKRGYKRYTDQFGTLINIGGKRWGAAIWRSTYKDGQQ